MPKSPGRADVAGVHCAPPDVAGLLSDRNVPKQADDAGLSDRIYPKRRHDRGQLLRKLPERRPCVPPPGETERPPAHGSQPTFREDPMREASGEMKLLPSGVRPGPHPLSFRMNPNRWSSAWLPGPSRARGGRATQQILREILMRGLPARRRFLESGQHGRREQRTIRNAPMCRQALARTLRMIPLCRQTDRLAVRKVPERLLTVPVTFVSRLRRHRAAEMRASGARRRTPRIRSRRRRSSSRGSAR